jgi:hypothetical protein
MTALSLILPCFNESERLPATLAIYLAQASSGSRVRVLGPGHPCGERAYAR